MCWILFQKIDGQKRAKQHYCFVRFFNRLFIFQDLHRAVVLIAAAQ